MFGSVVLEVAVGITFLFFLVSLTCSAIREAIEHALKYRARMLKRGLELMLTGRVGSPWVTIVRRFRGCRAGGTNGGSTVPSDGCDVIAALYGHPLIRGLFKGQYDGPLRSRHLPSYIPSNLFAKALFDIAIQDSSGMQYLTLSAAQPDPKLPDATKKGFQSAVNHARYDYDQAIRNLELWFDGSMDRVAGWYKRQTQWIIAITALVLAFWFDLDAIALARRLFEDTTLRETLVATAEHAASGNAVVDISQARIDSLLAATLFLGRERGPNTVRVFGFIPPLRDRGNRDTPPWVGWCLTALAATLGAPFWFDLLNKVMVIRSTVKPHEKSPPEGSEDRRSHARGSIVLGQAAGGVLGGGPIEQSAVEGERRSEPGTFTLRRPMER